MPLLIARCTVFVALLIRQRDAVLRLPPDCNPHDTWYPRACRIISFMTSCLEYSLNESTVHPRARCGIDCCGLKLAVGIATGIRELCKLQRFVRLCIVPETKKKAWSGGHISQRARNCLGLRLNLFIVRGAGESPHIRRFVQSFWAHQQLVRRHKVVSFSVCSGTFFYLAM